MPGNFECEYCKNTYSTKYTLKTHQEKTKSCMKIRENPDFIGKFNCSDCENNFSNKYNLLNHHKICLKRNIRIGVEEYKKKIYDNDNEIEFEKIKLKEEELRIKQQCNEEINNLKEKHKIVVDQKDNEIFKLETRISELTNILASKPTTNIMHNNNTNTMNKNNTFNVIQYLKDVNKPVNDKMLKESTTNLRLHHCIQGGKGFAEYAIDHALLNIALICTDVSRNKFQYTEEINGTVKPIVDPELVQFNPKFFGIIKEDVSNFLTPYMNDLLDTGDEENMQESTRISYIINYVNNASLGKSNDLTDEFLRCLAPRCTPSIIEKKLPI